MKPKGYTLVELLIAIGILILMLSLGMASFRRFNRRERLKQATATLKANLRFANTKAISAEKPSGCTIYIGVRVGFTANSYSTQHECDPEGLVGSIDTITLPTQILFSPIPTGFTYLTRSNTINITNDLALILTNQTETYLLIITQDGNINDEGFQ